MTIGLTLKPRSSVSTALSAFAFPSFSGPRETGSSFSGPFLTCYTAFVFPCASWQKIQVQVGECPILQADDAGQSNAIFFLTIPSRNKSQERLLLGVFCFVLNSNSCASCYQCLRFLISQSCLLCNICWPSRLINLHNYWHLLKLRVCTLFWGHSSDNIGNSKYDTSLGAGWLWEWYFQLYQENSKQMSLYQG